MSFFSPVHHTFSSIDLFLLDNKLLPQVCAVSYNAIVILDHAPVTLELSFPDNPNSRCPWRFNPLLLSEEAFTNHIASEIDVFVSTDVTPGVSASLVWETFKAYIRGQITAFSGSQSRQHRVCQSQLLASITELEDEYAYSPSSDLYKKLLILKSEFF